jgi:hypothetical protein
VTLCVYALTAPPRGPLLLRGLDGELLRSVTVGQVSAVVGERRQSSTRTREQLTRYDAAMHRLADRYAAILPVRFGTCLTRDELELILRDRQQSFRRTLRHVRGRAQMTVRIVGVERQKRDSVDRPRTGTDYLRRRAIEAMIPAFGPVRDAVRRWVRDERIETRDRIASVYHLIPRGAAEAYRSAAVARASEAGLRATISGPFPPYAFTEW